MRFVWCGGFSFGKITDGYEELKKVVENPPANVQFPGIIPRSDMNDIYNMADVLFMPSYNELFPMAILEAVNLHRPMVLRSLELYEDILFKKYQMADDNDSFAELIRKLHEDPAYYARLQLTVPISANIIPRRMCSASGRNFIRVYMRSCRNANGGREAQRSRFGRKAVEGS